VPYGTATYAAPEQARGDRVDSRADIFSTGVLLYEMLTGTWPFQGKTAVEVRHAVLNDEPEPLSKMRPGRVPAKLQAVLDKALAKDPRNRYQKISHFANDLREIIRELDFYQFSLADAVITELARLRSLVVRPSSVIVKYQNRTVDAAAAGREL